MNIWQSATAGIAGRRNARLLAASRPVCLLLIGLFVLLIPILGALRPDLNWDVLPYVGIVKSWSIEQPEAVQRAAYADVETFARTHGLDDTFQQLITPANSFRGVVAADPVAFWQQLPFYRIRPLYEAAVFLIAKLTATTTAAIVIITLIGTMGTNLIMAGVTVRRFGICRAVLPVALFAISPFSANVAELSSPDALLTLFVIVGTVLLLRSHDIAAALVLFCAVLVRSDAALLNLVLALALGSVLLLRSPHRTVQATVCVGILLGSIVVQQVVDRLAGNYGFDTLYHVTFFGPTPYPAITPPTPVPPWLMAKFFMIGMQQTVWSNGTFWTLLLLSLIAAGFLSYRPETRARLLLVAIFSWIVVRFIVFPAIDTRFMTPSFAALSILLVEFWPLRPGVPGRHKTSPAEPASPGP